MRSKDGGAEMKRKIIALCILAICLTGCEVGSESRDISTQPIVRTYEGTLYEFEPEGTLYIEYEQMIVPYYNKNGKMCHRIDGKVVEIDE